MWVRGEYCSKRNTLLLASALAAACMIVTIGGLPFHIMSKGTPAGAGLRSTQAQLIFAASMAASLALQGHWLTAFLRSSLMRVISDLSYCIYLVHLTVGDAYDSLLGYLQINAPAHLGDTWAVICKILFLTVVSFAIAAVSKRWLEDPARRLMRYFEQPKGSPSTAMLRPPLGPTETGKDATT
jgi:peptidoglycan/LPS O-acetylase OafA/YrhL